MASKSVDIWVNVKGNAQKSIASLNKSLKKTEGQTKKTAMGFKSIATAVGGLVVLKKAADWMKESTRLALEQEKAEKKLTAALGKTSQSLLDYASALQLKTTYGDEETIASMALVANFVKEEEQIKRITAAAQDMAEAKGMSLASATDLITKSVASSTNALTRYGIEIEGAAGSTERIDSAITNLTEKFGGMAEAAALTNAGQIKQMDNAIGDMRETIGKEFVGSTVQAKRAMKNLYSYITDNSTAVGRTIGSLAKGMESTLRGWNAMYLASKGEKVVAEQMELSEELRVQTALRKAALKEIEWANSQREKGLMTEAQYADEMRVFGAQVDKSKEKMDELNKSIIGIGAAQQAELRIFQADLVDNSESLEEFAEAGDGATDSVKKLTSATKDYGKTWQEIQQDSNIEMLAQQIEEEWQLKQDNHAKDLARKQENMQLTIDLATQTAQAVESVMSSVNTRKQQEYDNEVQRQKDEVTSSTMSAKQKASAISKIEAEASKERLKLRVKEWRQSIIMSIVNTGLGVTNQLTSGDPYTAIPRAAAVGALGFVQTGIIAGNKPKAYNGMLLDNKSGMNGDVIPVMARRGEEILSPNDPRNANNGGKNNSPSLTIGAPQVVIQGNATAETAETIRGIMSDFGREIEEMFTGGQINPSIVNQALAV